MIKHAPLIAFLTFTARLVVFGASLGDAFSLAALAGLYGALEYFARNQQVPVNVEVKQEIQELKGAINALKLSQTYKVR